ncbi:MAG: formate dehydrogenase subunit alpha [Deltaproteobacteria bacterium]|nr:formate dehydrogenase subunit alpha [Deltaproteobacteria bacterium]
MHLTINGRRCSFQPGMTMYEVARDHGIFIPVLCRHEDMRPSGSCRICSVEVQGCAQLVASCTQPAEPGMVIHTDTDAVRSFRRTVIELLLAQGNHRCSECASARSCVLRRLADMYGIERTGFKVIVPAEPLTDDGNEMIVRDQSICVLCGLCVQACNELQVSSSIGCMGRGPASRIGPPAGDDLAQSDCVFCGECVRVCPVGALREKRHPLAVDTDDDRTVSTTCAYCGVGCQMDLHVQQNRIIRVTTPRMGAPAPNNGSLCIKGRFGYDFSAHPDRLTHALVRRGGRLVVSDPDEAVRAVAQRLAAIEQTHGPDAIAGLASARCTNEENYLFQKFFRSVLGTNNVDHCARLCHSPSVAALADVLGSGAMTNSIADIAQSDCILVTGSNTTENHPVIGAALKRAVTARGALLIVVDPRRVALVRHASIWLRPRPGTDIAWINGLAHILLRDNLIDESFISDRTAHFDQFKESVAAYTPQRVQALTGIPADDLTAAARMYGRARSASLLYGMGITQHVCGTDTVRALANLVLMTGNIGRPGTGINPLRGQNNVQGACDMGCLPNVLPGYRPVSDPVARTLFERAWDCRLPDRPGLTTPQILEKTLDGSIKALFIMGENPMLSEPDSANVSTALGRLELLVCQDIFLNETARLADIVLPAAAWAEKDGTSTNTERRVQRVRRTLIPPGRARSDLELLCSLAAAMGAQWHYTGAEDVFNELRDLVPQYQGITYQRIESTGLQWPCPSVDHPGTPVLHIDGFPCGRALFSEVASGALSEPPDGEYPFILTTGRILYHYHTATMSGRSRALVSRAPDAFVEINPADAEKLGLTDGQRVRVISRRGEIKPIVCITSRCDTGVVFIPFHYCEAAANVLTGAACDPVAGIAEFKACAVKLEKSQCRSLNCFSVF